MRQGYMLSIATRYQRRNETNNTIALQSFLPDFLQDHPMDGLPPYCGNSLYDNFIITQKEAKMLIIRSFLQFFHTFLTHR